MSGTGSPVLLIQGVGVHGAGWRPQVEALRAAHECLVYDHRGVGRSSPPARVLSVESLAFEARALLDEVEWREAHVVGHSLGGLVALHLALAFPERVRSLALLCTFASGRDAAPLRPRLAWIGLRTKVGTVRQRRRAFLRLIHAEAELEGRDLDALAEELRPLFGHDLAVQPRVAAAQLLALRTAPVRPPLAHLSVVPTLVVSAEQDLIAPPRAGRALASAIPGARYVEVAGASHGLPITHAERVNALLHEHFAAVEARR